jgi:hypothetical protein
LFQPTDKMTRRAPRHVETENESARRGNTCGNRKREDEEGQNPSSLCGNLKRETRRGKTPPRLVETENERQGGAKPLLVICAHAPSFLKRHDEEVEHLLIVGKLKLDIKEEPRTWHVNEADRPPNPPLRHLVVVVVLCRREVQ